MNYTIQEIAAIVSGKIYPHLRLYDSGVVQKIAIDSRVISGGKSTLFVALKTSKNDGHNFIQEAYNKGVRNFIIEKKIKFSETPDASFVLVENSKETLQKLATHHRQEHDIRVIGITGSNGKTIVKEWLNQLLAIDFKIVRSPKSYNSQLGVPLSVLHIESQHNLGIFEAGISLSGEMENLEKIIQPNLGIITTIGESHLENFESKKALAIEKIKLFDRCKQVVIPHQYIQYLDKSSLKKLITWGEDKEADLIVNSLVESNETTIVSVLWKGGGRTFTIPFTDQASIENTMTSILVLLLFDYTEKEINHRLNFLSPIDMRLGIAEGINGCTLINDAYSLDLHSLDIALDLLAKHGVNSSRTVFVSDVLESGKPSKEAYKLMNQSLQNHHVDQLITIGEDIKKHREQFSMEVINFLSADDFLNDTKLIKSLINKDILVKGARKFSLEKIVLRLQEKTQSTTLEINLEALVNNLNYFKSLLGPQVKIMVMVKALSYGSGTHEIARVLEFNQVDYLGVAYTDEGVKLREAGISVPIMVMNPEWSHLIENNLEPEIFSIKRLKEFIDLLSNHPSIEFYPIHIKIDSGMHRLGFEEQDIDELLKLLTVCSQIKIASVFTHLSSSDLPEEDEFTHNQIEHYKYIADRIEKVIGYSFMRHTLNTSGILRFDQEQQDLVRLGIGIYGISSVQKFQKRLENVGTLKTHISQIKHIAIGDSIGYGRSHIATAKMKIATIPIGYADGFSRSFSQGKGEVFCKGKLVPVVGNVCMDMTMIDVTGLAVKEEDEVIIFGKEIRIEKLAETLNTIPYEVLTSISVRVKRVFVEQ